MIEYIAKKVYTGSMIVLGASLALLVASHGLLPFGFTVGWSESGYGTALVFARPDANASVGATVVGMGAGGGSALFSVTEVVRESGVTYYRATERGNGTGQEVLLRAGEHGLVALLSVPFVGSWVRALEHTLGFMALVGAPLTMLLMNGMLVFGSKLVRVASYVEQGAKRIESGTRRALQREKGVERDESYEEAPQDEYVTILKPFDRRYGV